MCLRVVTAVSEEHGWSASRSSDDSPDCRDRLDERQKLGDVMCVGPGEEAGERDTVGVGDQVMLGAGLAPIDRTRPGLAAPKSARSVAESQTARERSSRPDRRSRASSCSCSCCQTPACCQSRRRRQQVMPEPKPSSRGSRCQAIPVVSTNRIPFKHASVVEPPAARMTVTPRSSREKWLDQFPEFVVDQSCLHYGPPILSLSVSAHVGGLGS
jgi:hypothetical protein